MKKILTLLFLIQNFLAFSVETITIDSSYQQINLKNYCYNYKDTSNKLSIKEVLNVNWDKMTGISSFPSNKYVQWLRYNFYNPYNKDIERVIFLPYHHIHEIDVYAVSDSSKEDIGKTGIRRPFGKKDFRSIGYPLKIKLKSKKETSIFICIKHLYKPLRATTYLMTQKRVEEVIYNSNSLIWYWRGVFLFVFVSALILYYFVRLKLFLYYFLLNLGVGLFIASHIGDYFLFFNVDSSDITSSLGFTGTFLINLFFPRFLNALTPVKERNKFLWKWMYRFIYLMIVFYILTLFPAIRQTKVMYFTHFYFMILSGLVLILQPIMLLKCIVKKDKNALPLFIIYSLYVFVAFIDVILPNMGFIGDTPFIYNNLLIGSLFEIFSFMIIMGRETFNVYKERADLLEKQQEHQKEVIMSLVKGQEEERNRAGRELHDLIGTNMAIIKQKIDKKNKELYRIVSQTIESVRNLSHGLVTPIVKDEEFIDELKELCYLFTSDYLEVNCYFHKWPKIKNAEITNHLYRISQELLQNAVKHSKAKNVYLQFIGENNNLSLIYEDDGIGFDYTQTKHNGLGLNNVENRVTLLNGSLQIDTSEKGKGTTIVIEVQLV